MNKTQKTKLTTIEYFFYSNASIICWVLFVPFVVYALGAQSIIAISITAIVTILANIEFAKGIEYEKQTIDYTSDYWKQNKIFYNFRKFGAKAFLLGLCMLPVVVARPFALLVMELFREVGFNIPVILIEISIIVLVFFLSIISTKVLSLVSRILAIPVLVFSGILFIVILSNLFSTPVTVEVSNLFTDIHLGEIISWSGFGLFFNTSITATLAFDRSDKLVGAQRKKRQLMHSLSRAMLLLMIPLTLFYASLIKSNDSLLISKSFNAFELTDWSLRSQDVGVSFLFISLLILISMIFITTPQYLINRSKELTMENIFNYSVDSRVFSNIIILVLCIVFAFVPYNWVVIGGITCVCATYIVFFLYRFKTVSNYLYKIYNLIMGILLLGLIGFGFISIAWYVVPLTLLFIVGTNYIDSYVVRANNYILKRISGIRKWYLNLNSNKEVTLNELVNTQTLVVFWIILLIAGISWIFNVSSHIQLNPRVVDVILVLVVLIYYITATINSMLMIPKVRIYQDFRRKLEKSNKELVEDIKERKRIEKDLRYTSSHDSLSGLYSRDYIIKLLIEKIQTNQEFDLVFIDISRFKKINDIFGHSMGDKLLKKLSNRLKIEFLNIKDIGRFGGDEFLAIIDEPSQKNTINKSRSLINYFKNDFIYKDKHISIDLKVGVYKHKGGDITINTILKNIDFAIRYAKSHDEDIVEFNEEIRTLYQNNLAIEEDIVTRIEKRNFIQFYQPIINTKDKKILGFEQLIRIKKSGKYLLPPKYIQVAEETGLIEQIGWISIVDACKKLKELKKLGYSKTYISVNVSPLQFLQFGFVNKLKEICDKYEVDPLNLRLEITETVLLESNINIRAIMNELTFNNFKLYLDDFGTGFSNMSYLKKLPIDTLKIDKSFIRNADTNTGHALVRAIASLAKELSITVIAEGVEEPSQVKFLKSLQVNIVQGYLFAKPFNGDQLVKFLKKFEYQIDK